MAPAYSLSAAAALAEDNKTLLAIVGGLSCAAGAAYLWRRSSYKKKPATVGSGAVDSSKVKDTVKEFYGEYNTLERGEGAVLKESKKVADLVDRFYSLVGEVTDLYEWGWGQSFHFSPKLPGKDWAASEAAHEARLPALVGLGPGKTALDVGCGVGGPMRTIAATSGGSVVGITINQYQVDRATYHNEKNGLAGQCKAVRGNFLEMPFEDATFDAAYALEATCHAPTLEQARGGVYSEVFRVLKPGGRFATYEWVTTKNYDPSNRAHVAIMDEIIIGNGLPRGNSYKEAEAAGEAVGFRLVESRDIADASRGAVGLWYTRLASNPKLFKLIGGVNGALVAAMEAVHKMLFDTGIALIEGAQAGIFTPMHLLVFEKPAA
eukprot:scaffold18.g1978.t1